MKLSFGVLAALAGVNGKIARDFYSTLIFGKFLRSIRLENSSIKKTHPSKNHEYIFSFFKNRVVS